MDHFEILLTPGKHHLQPLDVPSVDVRNTTLAILMQMTGLIALIEIVVPTVPMIFVQ